MALGTVDFKIGFLGDDQLTAIVEKSRKGLDGLGKSARKSAKEGAGGFRTLQIELKGITAKIATVGSAFRGVQAMAGAVGAAIRSAFEFIEQGELAKRVETSFTQFAGDGLQRMDELREATGNLIDDTAIQQNVIRMKLFGSTIDEISETLAIASRVSRLTGEDFQATANRINDAIATGSAESLKVIGINTDLARAVDMAAAAIGKNAAEMTQAEIATARLRAVSDAWTDSLTDQGAEIDTVSGSVSSLSAQWSNMVKEMQKATSDIFDRVAADLGLLDETLALSKAERLERQFDGIAASAFAIAAGLREAGEWDRDFRAFASAAGLSAEEVKTLREELALYAKDERGIAVVTEQARVMIENAIGKEEHARRRLRLEQKKGRDEAAAAYEQKKQDVQISKDTRDWYLAIYSASVKAAEGIRKQRAATVASQNARARAMVQENELRAMEIAGSDALAIASRKLDQEYDRIESARMTRSLATAERAKAELEYQSTFSTVARERADADASAADAARERAERESQYYADMIEQNRRLQEELRAMDLEFWGSRWREFGYHVEGTASTVSAAAPEIAAGFGSIGAVLGIAGENMDNLAGAAPKMISAVGQVSTSTIQSVKAQAAIRSAFEFAAGIAAGARLDFWAAGQHAVAGAMYAAVAGTAGGGGRKTAGASAAPGIGAGGVGGGGGGGAPTTAHESSVTVNVQGLMSGTSQGLGVAIGETLSEVRSTGLGSRSV
tara:strand:- start:801 stop:2993 length:2193 start_codon:yes stop_codon:yes gene_type:complete